MFGRAKQKLLRFEVMGVGGEGADRRKSSAIGGGVARLGAPELGVTRSRFEYFRRERHFKVDDDVMRTNKLIIRLDKLITDTPEDPAKRKGILQSTWILCSRYDARDFRLHSFDL
ncbi:unnamed protein product [Soboliphyme baturini]|uniref:Uncharacterized protein n=1 Tax=Soboliphyme baturini TaxID=241478 RepID=A0A183J828_9BILA|nr:unnamed protein product [Soboliphyme baturini]